jgi:thioredoxin-like negative regulator of GroEL
MTSMAQAAPGRQPLYEDARPRLIFFFSPRSGRCRRVEAYVAQVLQRRRNHDTFALHKVDADKRPDLAQRFRVGGLPSLVVVTGRQIRARLEAPRGCRDIEDFLAPWLH